MQKSQPPPSKAGAGSSIDKGRHKTKTEQDLRRVQAELAADKRADNKRGEKVRD